MIQLRRNKDVSLSCQRKPLPKQGCPASAAATLSSSSVRRVLREYYGRALARCRLRKIRALESHKWVDSDQCPGKGRSTAPKVWRGHFGRWLSRVSSAKSLGIRTPRFRRRRFVEGHKRFRNRRGFSPGLADTIMPPLNRSSYLWYHSLIWLAVVRPHIPLVQCSPNA